MTADTPLILSVRQPWAWLIVSGWKNIENRPRRTNVRGRILIHASKTMTRADYEACEILILGFGWGIPLPHFDDLERGGIVGETTILDCVTEHTSEWFFGPFGYVLTGSKTLPFQPCKGSLGFFREIRP
jgi:hypothetical protein